MRVVIDGLDITKYIAFGGFKWTRNDIDGTDAGRTLDAEMHRNRVALKDRLDITCRLLLADEATIVLNAVQPEFVQVLYFSPMLGTEVTKTMYSNNIPATFCIRKPDGAEWWSGITFPLIEK